MKEEIIKARDTLSNGGIILYPTDTIWGLGCDATNEAAVNRIFGIKNRQDKRQMLILVAGYEDIADFVEDVPEIAIDFIIAANRPLSIIFQNAINLAPSLIGQDRTIGIRVVRDEFCKELIREFGKPIISTSANISGTPPPDSFAHIDDRIKESVDYIVKWRQDDLTPASPSDIIKFGEDGEIIKIR
jgi:L-threonylcarbamoyladenylate synthase